MYRPGGCTGGLIEGISLEIFKIYSFAVLAQHSARYSNAARSKWHDHSRSQSRYRRQAQTRRGTLPLELNKLSCVPNSDYTARWSVFILERTSPRGNRRASSQPTWAIIGPRGEPRRTDRRAPHQETTGHAAHMNRLRQTWTWRAKRPAASRSPQPFI